MATPISQIILDTIMAKGTAHWADIVTAVGREHRVKNWLKVRRHLQALLDAGTILRVNDVRIEAYTLALT